MNRKATPPLDVLMDASLYLMTRYAEEKRPDTAVALAQHLQWIAEQPGVRALAARQGIRTPLATMAAYGAPDIPALSHPVHTTKY
jgi:hypothetical protein